MLKKNIHLPPGNMMLYLLICVFVLSGKLQISRSSKVENYFYFVQSGVTKSNACILEEIPVKNSTVSSLLQCGLQCNALSQCVGSGYHKERNKTLSPFVWISRSNTNLHDIRQNRQIFEGIHFINYMFECNHFLNVR